VAPYDGTEKNVTRGPFSQAGRAGRMIAWLELVSGFAGYPPGPEAGGDPHPTTEDADGSHSLYLGARCAGFLVCDWFSGPFPVAPAQPRLY